MEKIYIGYVQGVHGLRGDLKIKNRFERPDDVFKKENTIYLNEEPHIITNSKFYKGFYLVTIDNLKDINLVLKYKGYDVYFKKEDLHLKKDDFILDDLIDLNIIYKGKNYGKVKEVRDNSAYKILLIDFKQKYMIPLIDEFIKSVDLDKREITVDNIEGLIL